MSSERKKSLSLTEVCFLDATLFVRLVLTGVRVPKFLNIAKFDLIFFTKHSYAICLSVCWSVCHSFLSVLSVYLSYVQYCWYVPMCEYWSFCTSVCCSACTSTFALSVCLSVCLCMSVRLYFCLSVCIFVHLSFCTSVCLSMCISAL
jgi:hypothetical protein